MYMYSINNEWILVILQCTCNSTCIQLIVHVYVFNHVLVIIIHVHVKIVHVIITHVHVLIIHVHVIIVHVLINTY